jgi:hypothetical protein
LNTGPTPGMPSGSGTHVTVIFSDNNDDDDDNISNENPNELQFAVSVLE